MVLGWLLISPLLFFLGLEDWQAGNRFEAGILLVFLAYSLGLLVFLKRLRNSLPWIRISFLFVLILLVVQVQTGGGGGYGVLWFFCFPVLAMSILGAFEGLLWAAASFMVALGLFLLSDHPLEGATTLRFLVNYGLVTLFSYGLESSRQQLDDRLREKKVVLEETLEQIKTLRGLLPICVACKRIREDGGYWRRLEEYVQHHSDAEFTHGLCHNCVQEYYSEVAGLGQAREGKIAGLED